MVYVYCEFDGMVFRGEKEAGEADLYAECFVLAQKGKWVNPTPKTSMDAELYGTHLSLDEAKSLAGKDWPDK